MRHTAHILCLTVASLSLAGCDALGIETAPQVAAKKDAEAHAIGSACRHAVRSIEACFHSNPKAVKAAMFDGWKEMDAYMRENEIVGMPSTDEPSEVEPSGKHGGEHGAESDPHAAASRKS